MLDEGTAETRKSLLKTKKICRAVGLAIWIAFFILAVFEAVTLGSIVASLAHDNGSEVFSLISLVLCIAYGLVAAVMLIVFSNMLSDVAKGDSPFTMMQVKRLRIISILLVVYGFIDNATSNLSSLAQFNGVDAGFVSTVDNAVFTVFLAPFIIAAVVYAFSFVFKYGVLLQELSDETL